MKRKNRTHDFYIQKRGDKKHYFKKESPKVKFNHIGRTRGHPSVIIGSNNKEYAFYGITHSSTTKKRKNHAMNHNPNPKDKRKSYLRSKSDFGKKKQFYTPRGRKWFIDPSDKRMIDNFVNMEKK